MKGKIKYIAPDFSYLCPRTGERFYQTEYCNERDGVCPFLNDIIKDGYGDSIFFKVILCEYQDPEESST